MESLRSKEKTLEEKSKDKTKTKLRYVLSSSTGNKEEGLEF
jgi:hypothetical protein